MKLVAMILACAGIVLAAGMAADHYASPTTNANKSPRSTVAGVPDITFHLRNGKRVGWEAMKGRFILLNFWASWCAPCREEMPQLAALAEQHADKLDVILISGDRNPADADSFLSTLNAETRQRLAAPNVHMVSDDKRSIANTFQVYQFPESYLIGPDLRIRQKIVGKLQPGDVELAD